MSGDLQDEDAVVPGVEELVSRRPAKRKSAEHEWSGVKS
ncbi:hypothetical protein SBA2_990005 [Acidobacteriia bacterium SbA2]|nr:hypothetical protein SBA2_990005 [Acidobacteriia bacterium SbA2]